MVMGNIVFYKASCFAVVVVVFVRENSYQKGCIVKKNSKEEIHLINTNLKNREIWTPVISKFENGSPYAYVSC